MKLLINVKISDRQIDELKKLSPQLEIVRETDKEKARQEMRDADILYTFVPRDLCRRPRLSSGSSSSALVPTT